MASSVLETDCCIVGGGPAGMMLGYMLARQGVTVTVLEKHKDFFRDFRGDTVHPSTLEVLKELGLLDDFLAIPHQRVESLGVVVGDTALDVADFRHLPTHCKFIALMPQWDFLNFLSSRAKQFPTFQLLMQHEVVDLHKDGKRITGVIAKKSGLKDVNIHANLVIGCDGRHSVTRRAAGLEVIEYGVPIDVLWFRLSRMPSDPADVLGNLNYGKALILINREDYFQAGLIIPKGSYDSMQARGLDAFRNNLLQIVPWLGERVNELRNWDQVKVLTVQINRLRRWHRPGLLCIGDAAHAMSPAGGVGINLAIQDSVATANLLTWPLLQGTLRETDLAAVQQRRIFPTRITQAVQLAAHNGLARLFQTTGPIHAPWPVKAASHIPGTHRALGYAVGIGARPEHVRNAAPQSRRSWVSGVVCAGIGVTVGAAVCGWAAWKLWSKATSSANKPRIRRAPELTTGTP